MWKLLILVVIVLFVAFCISNKYNFRMYRRYKGGTWFKYEIVEIGYTYWTQEIQSNDRLRQTERYEPK